MEVIQQPVLHVEARVKNTGDGMIVRTDLVRSLRLNPLSSRANEIQIRNDITQWLIDNFVVLSLGQEIYSFGNEGSHMLRFLCVG